MITDQLGMLPKGFMMDNGYVCLHLPGTEWLPGNGALSLATARLHRIGAVRRA